MRNIWATIGGRKFVAFALASVFFFMGKLSEQGWLIALGVYVGANVLQKILKK